ncbi:MAG: vitamin K epoxide reductase family protein [Armatimonadota bacterium]|nr:vitamin K epoxide reductase family protein [Armatimonadota bacterium]MDR7532269.1 vitamin K epoxide reductase family protein [Armatimonadota bacterium]MDR7537258.1 vitamin K epoxide reductase family protein [Armatimonadota bacterium]
MWWGAAGLAAGGVVVTGVLTALAARGAPPVCLVGACEVVSSGPYARFLGLPLGVWGLAAFAVVTAVALLGARGARRRAVLLPVLVGLVAFGAGFSAYLTWLQVVVLRAVCAWCAASALVWAALAATGGLLAASRP